MRYLFLVENTQSHLRKSLLVGIGGAAGSVARWALSLVVVDHGFPWATLMVNLVGSVILLIALELAELHPEEIWWWRPLFAAGFCGGFTTYSAFAVKLVQYLQGHEYLMFVAYSSFSIIGTFILLWVVHEVIEKTGLIHNSLFAPHIRSEGTGHGH
jgi:fluoride exporter